MLLQHSVGLPLNIGALAELVDGVLRVVVGLQVVDDAFGIVLSNHTPGRPLLDGRHAPGLVDVRVGLRVPARAPSGE